MYIWGIGGPAVRKGIDILAQGMVSFHDSCVKNGIHFWNFGIKNK